MVVEKRQTVMSNDPARKERIAAGQPDRHCGARGPHPAGRSFAPSLPVTLIVVETAPPDCGHLELRMGVPSAGIEPGFNLSNHRPLGLTQEPAGGQ